ITMTPGPALCSGAWSLQAPYPLHAADQAAVRDPTSGQVYVFGGFDESQVLAAAYRYAPATNTWTPIAPLPAPRSGARAVAAGSFLSPLGGNDAAAHLTATLWRYDPATDSYQSLAPFTQPTAFLAAVYLAGKIYRIAGAATATVEVYDIS